MQREEHLPLMDRVEETRAKVEDRIEQSLVPKLESLLSAVSSRLEAARERLGGTRGRAR